MKQAEREREKEAVKMSKQYGSFAVNSSFLAFRLFIILFYFYS